MSVFRFATVQGQSVQWTLKRNCSVSPRQLGAFFASLSAVSLVIAVFCWLHGATLVLPFTGLELLALGTAFLAYARHATDGECIRLQGRELIVELETGGRLEKAQFQCDWVHVEPQADDHSLIELSGRGRKVRVGRFLRPELRPLLAQEIRRALRDVARGLGPRGGDDIAIEVETK